MQLLQLVEAVHHRLTLLAQVELTVAAQADGLAQRLPPHLRVLALWSSIALTGAVLILIYHL